MNDLPQHRQLACPLRDFVGIWRDSPHLLRVQRMGVCSVSLGSAECIVVHALWRWRWVWRFATSRIHSVFLYDPPPAYIMWPGSSGLHIRVSIDRAERSVPVASGLHVPRETLDRIQSMLLMAAESAGVVAPGSGGAV